MWFPKCKNWQYEDIMCNTNILEHNQHENKLYFGRKCFFWEFPTQVSTDMLDTQDDIGSYASVIFSQGSNNLGSKNWEDLNGKYYCFFHYY